MPTYKDDKTWYVKFYYTTYDENRVQKFKRGFRTKKEAEQYEREFLLSQQYQPSMLFIDFLEIYKKDVYPTLRKHSIQNKTYVQNNRVLPFFKDYRINEITTKDIKKYQNWLLNKGYSSATIKGGQREFSAIMNHAVKFYNLKENPASKVGTVKNPNEMPSKMRFWTFEEFSHVISLVEDKKTKLALNLLYWSGMRKGEMFALTYEDINYINNTVTISKSYQRLNGNDIVTPTKTYEIREIKLPNFLIEDIKEYQHGALNPNGVIIEWGKTFMENEIKRICTDTGIKRIHIHGLRHSHASYLINKGVNVVLISKRLGHKNTSMTLDTYSHFFPNDEINLLNTMNEDYKNMGVENIKK